MKKSDIEAIDIRMLRMLEVLLQERHVSRAARRLDLSQPAMSHVLARLRVLFDDPLLVRGPSGMICSDRANEIASTLRDVLSRFEQLMRHESTFDPATSGRTFAVTAAPYTEHVLLPEVVRSLRRAAPATKLEIRTPVYGRAHELLERGEVDVLLAWGRSAPPSSLRSMLLFHDRLVCMTDRPPAERSRPLSLEEYLDAAHIRTQGSDKTTTGKMVDGAVAQYGRSLTIALLAQNYSSIPRMVSGTDLIATVPYRIAVDLAAGTELEIVPPPIRLPQVRMMGYWHERSHNEPGHKWFRSVVAECGRKLRDL